MISVRKGSVILAAVLLLGISAYLDAANKAASSMKKHNDSTDSVKTVIQGVVGS